MDVVLHMTVIVLLVCGTDATGLGSCRYENGTDKCALPCHCVDGNCDPERGYCLSVVVCEKWSPNGNAWPGNNCRSGNVASGKRVNQSGTITHNWQWVVVDKARDAKCTMASRSNISGLWTVDLGNVHYIEKVLMYKGQGREMGRFTILVGNSSQPNDPRYCSSSAKATSSSHEYAEVTCGSTMMGKYVVLTAHRGLSITLCKVVVIGRRVKEDETDLKDGKKTWKNERAKIGVIVVTSLIPFTAISAFIIYRRKRISTLKKNAERITMIQRYQRSFNGQDTLPRTIRVSSFLNDEVLYGNVDGTDRCHGTAIKVEDLKSCIEGMIACDLFAQEFRGIPWREMSDMADCFTASLPENHIRNRFLNIKAYDSTRVILKVTDKKFNSDYINANYITGYKDRKKAYVAAQAPTPHTTHEFWQMIWQLKANRIVMLTRTLEDCKSKSHQYWPEHVGEEVTFGDFCIRTVTNEKYTNYALSILNVSKEREARTVQHVQFLSWPDKSVPEQAYPLISFRKKVRSMDNVSSGPMIVHCSAGIGRTGTFIALDYLLEQAKSESEIDVITLIIRMRTERMNMIQTLDEYRFVYSAVLEAVFLGDTAIPNADIQHQLTLLSRLDGGGSCLLNYQFDTLQGLKPSIPAHDVEGRRDHNAEKNRRADIVPDDRVRPTLMNSGEDETSYINAVFVDDFRSDRGIIVTQMPLPHTVDDFWKLVHQYRRSTIVMLNTLAIFDGCTVYWPTDAQRHQIYGDIEVTLVSSDNSGFTLTRVFEVKKAKPQWEDPLTVKQFQFLDWTNSEDLPTISSMLALIDKVDLSANDADERSLLVHCMDGATRSGLFCAARYIVEKMKADNEVDVFLAVRCVSNSRPQFVNTLEQYRFLHMVAVKNVSKFGLYVNI